jgi:WxL interacting protein linking bacterial and host surfaces
MKTSATLQLMFTAMFMSIFIISSRSQELEVTPGTLMFKTDPGSSQTQQIFVRNKAKTEQSFVFNIADWLTDENGEVKYFQAGTTNRSCANWITVSPAVITLQPNESVRVNITMLVPDNDPSTKWAVLFVQSAVEKTGAKAIDKDVQMGLQVAVRIAVPIYQSPVSNTLFKGALEGLEQVIDSIGNRTFKSQVMNLGDKILNCKVYFTISNIETAEEFTSNPTEFSLLPESAKFVEFTTEKPLTKGRYSIAAILDYGYNEELDGIQLDIDVE